MKCQKCTATGARPQAVHAHRYCPRALPRCSRSALTNAGATAAAEYAKSTSTAMRFYDYRRHHGSTKRRTTLCKENKGGDNCRGGATRDHGQGSKRAEALRIATNDEAISKRGWNEHQRTRMTPSSTAVGR